MEVSQRPLDGAEWSRRSNLRRSTTSWSKVVVAEERNTSAQALCWHQDVRRRCWRTAATPFLERASMRGAPNCGDLSASFLIMSKRAGFVGPSGISGRTWEVAALSQEETLAASTMSRGSWSPPPPSRIGRVDSRHWGSGREMPTTVAQADRSKGLAWLAVQRATSGAEVRRIQVTLQADRHCRSIREAARGQPRAPKRVKARS